MSSFATLPHAPTIPIRSFRADIAQSAIDDLSRRLHDTSLPRKTFENSHTKEELGVTWDWMKDAVDQWKTFDWSVSKVDIAP
jgi:hypothetical protein